MEENTEASISITNNEATDSINVTEVVLTIGEDTVTFTTDENIATGESATATTTVSGLEIMEAETWSISSITYTTVTPEPQTKVIEGSETSGDFTISNITLTEGSGEVTVTGTITNNSITDNYYVGDVVITIGSETITFTLDTTIAAEAYGDLSATTNETSIMEADAFSISDIDSRIAGLDGPQYADVIEISNLTITTGEEGEGGTEYTLECTVTNTSTENTVYIEYIDLDLYSSGEFIETESVDFTGNVLAISPEDSAPVTAGMTTTNISGADDFAISAINWSYDNPEEPGEPGE